MNNAQCLSNYDYECEFSVWYHFKGLTISKAVLRSGFKRSKEKLQGKNWVAK